MVSIILRVWHVDMQAALGVCAGHTGPILAMHTALEGHVLVTASEDASACVWDLRHPSSPLHTLRGHTDW
jgi:WD40 repeat protein